MRRIGLPSSLVPTLRLAPVDDEGDVLAYVVTEGRL
jgi:hypothetical protein